MQKHVEKPIDSKVETIEKPHKKCGESSPEKSYKNIEIHEVEAFGFLTNVDGATAPVEIHHGPPFFPVLNQNLARYRAQSFGAQVLPVRILPDLPHTPWLAISHLNGGRPVFTNAVN